MQLLSHNQKAVEKIEKSYSNGENITAILHATGTGKSLIALSIIKNHPQEKIIFITRYNSIIEHIKELISENIEFSSALNNITFMTYSSLVNMTKEELNNLDVDLLITDEFHHIGAPVWNNRIETIIESHQKMRILGLSAYSVRDRGTPYEKDMAEPNGNEIFSDKICSTYNLVEALLDRVLPLPRYKTALTELEKYINNCENKIKTRLRTDNPLYKYYIGILSYAKEQITLKQKDMDSLIKENIAIGDKYIYFCPPDKGNEDINIDIIMAKTKEKLLSLGYNEEDIIFYKTTGALGEEGKKAQEAFYKDRDLNGNKVKDKLRIMFAINQYNEGVHVPRLTGVILGRETRSDIVFFEQIGRALSIRGKKDEERLHLEALSLDELLSIAKIRHLKVTETMNKNDIIDSLLSPIIIDLAGNFTYIRDLITDIKKEQEKRTKNNNQEEIKPITINEDSFDIEIIGEDIYHIIEGITSSFAPRNFEEIYQLAKKYYDEYGNLQIPRSFKTEDGITYSVFGYSLGEWLAHIRSMYKKGELNPDQIKKLEELNINWNIKKTFSESLELAKEYYKKYNHLNIPYNYKTEDGYSLGLWLVNMRRKKKIGALSKEQIASLEDLEIKWEIIRTFKESYTILKKYYEYYGNINLPANFITIDGINYDESGINLTEWLNYQKNSYHKNNLSSEKILLLETLKIDWGTKKEIATNITWDEAFALAKTYFNTYHNLKVKRDFKTNDGINFDATGFNLGAWLSRQIVNKKKGKLNDYQVTSLESIGIKWNTNNSYKSWDESYKLAESYYKEYGNLYVPTDYRTKDGYNLSNFIYLQRKKREEDKLTEEQIAKLDAIGMIWNNTLNYQEIKETLKEHGLNPRKYSESVRFLSILEFKAKIKFLEEHNLPLIENQSLNHIFFINNELFQKEYGISITSLIELEISHRKN